MEKMLRAGMMGNWGHRASMPFLAHHPSSALMCSPLWMLSKPCHAELNGGSIMWT